MAQISKEDFYKILQSAPQGTSAEDVADHLIGQGHDIEGYNRTWASPQAQQSYQRMNPNLLDMAKESLGQASELPSKVLSPIVAAGKMAYKGWGDIADVLTNPKHPLYNDYLGILAHFALGGNTSMTPQGLTPEQESKAINTIPMAAGVPKDTLGAALSSMAGASELGLTKSVTEPLESTGQSIAKNLLMKSRLQEPAARLASENMGQFLSSGPEDIQAGNQAYSNASKLLGIKPIEQTLGDYPGATGEYADAIKGFSGKKGVAVLKQGTDASYQDLHNIVEATTEMRMRPALYRDMGTMRDIPKQVAIDLDSMKSNALKLIGQKAGQELAEAQDAGMGEVDEVRGRLAAYDAAMQLPQIRKDLAIAHISSKADSLVPLNMNGTQSQLGTLETLGGLATGLSSGHPLMAAYAASRSPLAMKMLLGAGYTGYQAANPQAAADVYSLLKGESDGK